MDNPHDDPVCICCAETDFPVTQEPGWRMGILKPMKLASKAIQRRFGWTPTNDMRNAHLCGNCYFDLTD